MRDLIYFLTFFCIIFILAFVISIENDDKRGKSKKSAKEKAAAIDKRNRAVLKRQFKKLDKDKSGYLEGAGKNI